MMKKSIIRSASTLLLMAIISLAFRVPNTNIRRNRFCLPKLEVGENVIVTSIPSDQSIEIRDHRKAAELQLNQRKLIREMKQIRYDSQVALELLGSVYQHLAIPATETHADDDEIEWSYEQLVDILHQDTRILSNDAAELLVIDGKSTSMAIEVLCRARNVSAAMILLKRSVDGVIYNRKLREKYKEQTSVFWQGEENDNNELTTIYKSILSLLGRAQSLSTSSYAERQQASVAYSNLTLHLLRDHITLVAQIQPGLQIYHAALNTLGRHGSSEAIRTLLNDMKPDRMAYQIAISSLAKCGKCLDATQLLHQMREKGFSPDVGCYNELLIGIARQAGRHQSGKNQEQDPISWHRLALEILHDIESQSDLAASITDQTYNSIISACAKEKAWEAASTVASKASNSTTFKNDIGNGENDEQSSSYFSNLEAFRKNGKGSDAWWEIAEYNCSQRTITVGIQPHRNPKLNGMSLVFYRDDLKGNKVKVGRVLLKNDGITTEFFSSSIIGMEVNAKVRGEGLSKVLIAIWLDICLQTECFPRAAVMNKPLIALVLSKFGFIPDDGGTKCILVRLKNDDNDNTFGLYSPQKSLDGALSHRVLRTQNIKLLRTLPDSSRQTGVDVVIKTTFRHPHKPPDGNRSSDEMLAQRTLLKNKINAALNLGIGTHTKEPTSDSCAMTYFSSGDKLSKAFLFV